MWSNTVKSTYKETEKELRIVGFSLLSLNVGDRDVTHCVACPAAGP
jgi:hypothetical protein